MFSFPFVETVAAKSVLAAEVRDGHACFNLFEDFDDLMFGEPGSFHVEFSYPVFTRKFHFRLVLF